MENHLAATHEMELMQGIIVSAGFADLHAVKGRYLVRADNQCARSAGSDRSRFFTRQSQRCLWRRFIDARRFVDIRLGNFKRQA